MPELFNSKYYTLDKINPLNLKLIDKKVSYIINTFNIKKWPVDLFKIFRKNSKKGLVKQIPFLFGMVKNISKGFNAVSVYREGIYSIIISKDKIHYPYRYSRDRRLNFTLAHELGHIVLGHLEIPRHLKNSNDIEIEEFEADEFAGRLLVPEKIITSCNYPTKEKVAQYFIISNQALWKRLNNLKRLDLLNSKSFKVCDICGNIEISPYTSFCKICGSRLMSEGVIVMKYEEYELNENGQVIECLMCENEEITFRSKYCKICGSPTINRCTDETCDQRADGNARFCEICGQPTTFYVEGLLKDWKTGKTYSELQKEKAEEEAAAQKQSLDDGDLPF